MDTDTDENRVADSDIGKDFASAVYAFGMRQLGEKKSDADSCPSCGRKQKDGYPIRFSILPVKIEPSQFSIKVPAYCEGCGFSWYAVYWRSDEIIER